MRCCLRTRIGGCNTSGGEIVEVVSNNTSSMLGSRMNIWVGAFVMQHNLGFTMGADGGYRIGNDDYIPDCAFVSKQRQAKPSREAYNRIAPDLAIEVLSPSNSDEELRVKIANYLLAGTTVWVINPTKKRVEVYMPAKEVQKLELDATLEGGSVLPGFTLKVADIFANID